MNSKILTLYHNPIVRLIIGATAISFSGVWVAIADVSPSSSAFYRVLFGSLFLFVIILNSNEKLANLKPHLFLGFLCGVVFAADLFCWHRSIKLVGPGLATLLGNFQVFILAGIGVMVLKERYSKQLLLALPLAITGLFLIVGLEWEEMTASYRIGIVFGLATALFYSAYILCLKKLYSGAPGTIASMLLVSAATAIVLAGYMLFADISFAIPHLTSLFSLACLGFLSQCFGWVLIATSLPRTTTSSAGLILLLQPSLSFLWDVLFFNRPTEPLNWLGVVITLFSIYLGINAKKNRM
jgi:drug/metabolite transporter (DMT)-like permease